MLFYLFEGAMTIYKVSLTCWVDVNGDKLPKFADKTRFFPF